MAVSTIDPNGLNIGQIGGRRNLIINGAMQIYQRNGGTLSSTSGEYGPDRFELGTANLDNLAGTLTQDSDAPDNFGSSLKITVTTAETAIAADEYAYIHQRIEAQNLQGLGYGTSSAKQLTLSFWVKSSVTGTFAVGLYKPDNTAQIHNKTYTINSANTWEYKTVTFEANSLAGGAIDNDNGIGFYLNWHLAAGSNFKGTSSSSGWISYVNTAWADGQDTDAVITTTNATWQLAGVQLEVGDVATPFEHRSYGEELNLCKRYFERLNFLGTDYVLQGQTGGASTTANGLLYYTEKRTAPTVTLPSAGTSSGTITFLTPTGGYPSSVGSHTIQVAGPKQCRVYGSGYSGLTAGRNSILFSTGTNSVDVDAEL
jgi:hypothetical protein